MRSDHWHHVAAVGKYFRSVTTAQRRGVSCASCSLPTAELPPIRCTNKQLRQ